jgi:CMP-N-acetylneuraminic acid synthetase
MVSQDPYIVYLQPTSPLRTSRHIDEAFILMQSKSAKLLMSVFKLDKSPYKAFILGKNELLEAIFSEQMSNANRQSLPLAFYPNGAIYIFQESAFKKRGCFPSNGSLPYVMSDRDSMDIDSEDDLAKFEQILKEVYG